MTSQPFNRSVLGPTCAAALAIAVVFRPAHGQDTTEAAQPANAGAEPAAASTAGVLPLVDYTGDIWTRRAMLGDLNGGRTSLAESGIQFGIDWNNTIQSVVSGGRNRTTQYGGTLDYNLSFDLMRMGILPGAVIKLRGESRYGNSVNLDAGPALPVGTDMFFPLTTTIDEEVPIALTTLSYTQFLSDSFAFYLGKFDTLDGDLNDFASGRGLTQFQGMNFIFNPVSLITVPYCTLGGGIVWSPKSNITITSGMVSTTDSSTTSGFDTLDEGWTWASEMQIQYRLGSLPGGVTIGGTYAWDQAFAEIDKEFIFLPGEGISPGSGTNSSWTLYANVWQYLFAEDSGEGSDAPLNLLDGRPDVQGFGIFARVGIADQNTNPIEFAFSIGLGGRGVIPGRDDDVFGIGYYFNDVQTERVPTIIGARDSYQGFEAFYNVAITPASGLTFDVQVVDTPTARLDTAVVLGARFLVRF